jgi:hypothetical protein
MGRWKTSEIRANISGANRMIVGTRSHQLSKKRITAFLLCVRMSKAAYHRAWRELDRA